MMKKRFLFLLLLLFIVQRLQAQHLESLLAELPDVILKEVESKSPFVKTFELNIKQPLDHTEPSKGFFYQRALLSHVGFDKPTVLVTEGYQLYKNSVSELATLLNANQLRVEHRFFGESVPDVVNYNDLNLKQATSDLHYINTLFKAIYSGKWISTGISKGGSTTIFYRYFYPDDVDVSVPYVAPINNAFEDKRIYDFLNSIGSEACRVRIRNFQKRILKNRKEVIPMLTSYSKKAGISYSYLSFEEAFEYAVLEFSFSFWQYGYRCEDIPDENSSLTEAVDYLNSVSNIGFFGDRSMTLYAPHYYQSASEMGYYGYETKPFKGLLKSLPLRPRPHAAFTPGKMRVKFNRKLLKAVNKWLKTDPGKFIYINGALDTWSATAVPPSENENSVWFFMENKHHGSARIANMNAKEGQKLRQTLERWLEFTIEKPLSDKK